MEILQLSKEKKNVVVTLSSDELVRLCNVLYNEKVYQDAFHYKLYGEMIIARDLCLYGHIDDFCFNHIASCREKQRIDREESN